MLRHADYFEKVAAHDIPLGAPAEHDWLFGHKEKGQSYTQYKALSPPKATAARRIIYLKPIGAFSALQDSVLELSRQYVELFFQLPTVLLPPTSDSVVPESRRRWRLEGFEQLLAPYVLDSLLKGRSPQNGIALMAITEKDLYPSEDWNYVFGLASYQERVGVSSIYRLQNEQLDSSNFKLCLSRLIKIASHEIGHMFFLHHCTNARCFMNGSNHLGETDRTPTRPCSEYQKKLLWNFRYDNSRRLQELMQFLRHTGLEAEWKLWQQDQNNLTRLAGSST